MGPGSGADRGEDDHEVRVLRCLCYGCLMCAFGDRAVKKKKREPCHPHSWNVMHAVHRVYFKRGPRRGGGSGERGVRSFRRLEPPTSTWGPPLNHH